MKFKIGEKVLFEGFDGELKATVIGFDAKDNTYLLGIDDSKFGIGHSGITDDNSAILYDEKYDHYSTENKCWWAEERDLRKDERK